MLEGNKFFGKKKQKDKGAKGMGSARRAGWGVGWEMCEFKEGSRVSILEKVISEQSLDGSEAVGCADIWGKSLTQAECTVNEKLSEEKKY